jgi:hypothetical protein
MHRRRRAGAIWVALIAFLGNVLLPAALSIIARDIPGVGLCSQWHGDAQGKPKPGLLVQHCPLCAMPAAPLPRAPSITGSAKIADQRQLQLSTTVSVAPIRHGRMQARAPPPVV